MNIKNNKIIIENDEEFKFIFNLVKDYERTLEDFRYVNEIERDFVLEILFAYAIINEIKFKNLIEKNNRIKQYLVESIRKKEILLKLYRVEEKNFISFFENKFKEYNVFLNKNTYSIYRKILSNNDNKDFFFINGNKIFKKDIKMTDSIQKVILAIKGSV